MKSGRSQRGTNTFASIRSSSALASGLASAASSSPARFRFGRMRAVAVGMTVTETSSERPTAQEIASAMSPKSCPTSSSRKRIGTNTARVVRVDAITAPHTSCVPFTAATKRRSPFWYQRKMFSRTTIALSTSMPMAKAMPARLITLSERPISESSRNVPITLVGIASAITKVGRMLLRKISRTIVVRTPPSRMFCVTS